jgi:hypothetical protein
MIAWSLYADLVQRGVRLSIAPTPKQEAAPQLPALSLRVQAPPGALNEHLRAALAEYRADLLQFVFELEERAAILEYEQGQTRPVAEELARGCVRGGHAGPDGELWLRAYAETHPDVRHLLGELAKRGGGEIVSVTRVTDTGARAA